MRAGLCVALLLTGLGARAQQRLDHRGAMGLLLGSGGDYRSQLTGSSRPDSGLRLPLDLGGTVAVGDDGNEMKLVLRAELLGPALIAALYGGYRGYFGSEAVKTFFDLDLRADLAPLVTVGPRVGFGAQYELHSLLGAYLGFAAHVGVGQGIRFGGEVVLGFQLRSYLLE